MNLNQLIKAAEALTTVFPNLPISNAINSAKELIDSGKSPQEIASQINLNPQGINELYQKFGNNPKARTMLSQVGFTPEQIRDSAINLTKGTNNTSNVKNVPTKANNNGFKRI